jgi:hypothetical protein
MITLLVRDFGTMTLHLPRWPAPRWKVCATFTLLQRRGSESVPKICSAASRDSDGSRDISVGKAFYFQWIAVKIVAMWLKRRPPLSPATCEKGTSA